MSRKVSLLFALVLTGASAQQPSASVSGTLVGDDGTAIAGGFITLGYQRAIPPGRTLPPLSGPTEFTLRSESGGTFRVEGLRPGNYVLCAQVPKSVWLPSCHWGSQPMTISVSAGQENAVTVVMRKGALLLIRVEDPGRVLVQGEGKTSGGHVLIGVGGNDALFRPALLVSEDVGGRSYQNLVPFDFPVKVVLSSSSLQLADERGTPVQSKTTVVSLTAVRGQPPPSVRVIVTGTRTP